MLALTLVGSAAVAPTAAAEEAPRFVQFSGSGFLSLVAGHVLSGTQRNPISGYDCPCYIADFATAAVYERDGTRFKPDSKLGLQGNVTFGKVLSVTGQVVARGARDGNVNLEWIYASYKPNDLLTLQLGRKRLPLFYYSESQDVGLSFPWVRLPPQTYGWEITNYNGANLLYRDQWGSWSAALNVFGGSETKKDNDYWKLYNGRDSRTDSKWSAIVGAELSLNRDWLDARAVYIQSKIQNKFPGEAEFAPKAKQQIYGFSIAADYEQWVVRSELLFIDRMNLFEKDAAQSFGVGYRIGKFLPMITYSNFRQLLHENPNSGPDDIEGHSNISALLRWDVTTSSAIKVQYDSWRDRSKPNFAPTFFGSSKLLSVSYDTVF